VDSWGAPLDRARACYYAKVMDSKGNHPIERRRFLSATATAFGALALASCGGGGSGGAPPGPTPTPTPAPTPTPTPTPTPKPVGYGALQSDPAGLLDLPAGFSYQILSASNEVMSDGLRVPENFDGMGCFQLPGGKLALVRNHELLPGSDGGGTLTQAYDTTAAGVPLPGGTTTLVLNQATLAVEQQFRSLSGTIRNCSGGITPWGTWLTCEEDTTKAGTSVLRDHGYAFEVPANATGPVTPVPLTAMGRFRREAAVVDPVSGAVYMTEDQDNSLLYRFLPTTPGQLAGGGQLQALALTAGATTDSRNWTSVDFTTGQSQPVRWIDLAQPESPNDDLRARGLAGGALRFARGEGIFMGSGELYFVCTSGGAARLGQVFRLSVAQSNEQLQLFFESNNSSTFYFGDNIAIAPDGQLIICEDQPTAPVDNHLRGITRAGALYDLARLRIQTELAGACFSPDGRTMFLNIYNPGKTLAITGPWQHLSP
jgi:uncharacterized protein